GTVLPSDRHGQPAADLLGDRPQREVAVRCAAIPRLARALSVARLARARGLAHRAVARRHVAAEAAMIAWRAPLILAVLVIVPAAIAFLVWAERRRRRDLDRFVASGLQGVVVPDVDARRRRLRAGLVVAALGALVLALAGPMWGFRWERVHREGVDLVIAIDTSRSMLAEDVKPNR